MKYEKAIGSRGVKDTLVCRAGRFLAIAVFSLSLGGCAMLGSLMPDWLGGAGDEPFPDTQVVRNVHKQVADMGAIIIKELTLMLKDDTLTKAQGEAFAPAIMVFNEAIKASAGYLLQASQQRALGNEAQASAMENLSNGQLTIANGSVDQLRAVHLGALDPVMLPMPPVVPPLLMPALQ